jgi:hypothetical protein
VFPSPSRVKIRWRTPDAFLNPERGWMETKDKRGRPKTPEPDAAKEADPQRE